MTDGEPTGEPVPDGWRRPLFESGGDPALVFLVVFGVDVDRFEVSPEDHRVGAVAEQLELLVAGPEAVQAFLEPPIGDVLREEQPALVDQALRCETCLIIRGEIPDPADLVHLRTAIGIATAALDAGAVAVYNLQSFRLFSPSQWRSEVFEPDRVSAEDWVVILSSDDDPPGRPRWLHTRGLRLFGRPDLSLLDVPADEVAVATRLLSVLIDQLVRGLMIPDGAVMDATGSVGRLTFHRRGDEDDPDFNNVHLAIDWDPAV